MTDKFVASNGISVNIYFDSTVEFVSDRAEQEYTFAPSEVKAIREFFRHERDRELGRERVEGYPDYAVYRYEGTEWILVLDERSGESTTYGIQDARGSLHPRGEVARAWFAAQEPPKPWLDAKPGEVWLLTIKGNEQAAVRAFGPDFHLSSGAGMMPRDERITAGRRIWPEAGDGNA